MKRRWSAGQRAAVSSGVLCRLRKAGASSAVACLIILSGAALANAAGNDELTRYKQAEKLSAQHIAAFDALDFEVFSHQKWKRLRESHAQNVTVHWPDGRVTHGLEDHIKDLKAMFVYAPDTRIEQHPVKIAQGEWTSVIGVMQGSFTKPMPTANGKKIPPNGKEFRIVMCTVGHWKNGVMDEEYLFWDNKAYMSQLGL